MSDYVYNAFGTSGPQRKCLDKDKSWLAHRVRGTGLDLPERCCAKYCGDYGTVGAYVLHPDDLPIIFSADACLLGFEKYRSR